MKHSLGSLLVLLGLLVAAATAPAKADTVDNLARMLIDGSEQAEEKTAVLRDAFAQFEANELEQALASLNQAHQSYPTLPPGRLLLALFFLDAARTDQARQQLEAAAIEFPQLPLTYDAFGRLALIEGHITDADLHFQHALALMDQTDWDQSHKDRMIREANLGLASVAERRQQWEAARNYLETAVELRPAEVATRRRLAKVLFLMERFDEAFAELTQSVKDDPTLEPPEASMARLFAGIGNQPQAESWFERALDQHPDDQRVLVTYGAWLLDRGRESEAADRVKQAIQLAPADPGVKSLLAVLAHAVNKFDIAEQYFQELHQAEPENVDYSNYLALALIEQDPESKHKKAFRLAESNAREYPGSEQAQATLGWVYRRLGRIDLAEEALKRAVSAGRASADTVYFYARVAAELGRIDEARAMLRRALENDGRFLYRAEAQQYLDQITVSKRGSTDEPDSRAP